jgi:hypothetical protein
MRYPLIDAAHLPKRYILGSPPVSVTKSKPDAAVSDCSWHVISRPISLAMLQYKAQAASAGWPTAEQAREALFPFGSYPT